MSVQHIPVDLTREYPDLRPGDVIVGVHSANGIVNALILHRPTDEPSRFAYQCLRDAGVPEETARQAVPAVLALANSGRLS